MVSVYLYDTSKLVVKEELRKRCEQASESRIKAAFGHLYNYPDNNKLDIMLNLFCTEYNVLDEKKVLENIGASTVLDEALKEYGLNLKSEEMCAGRFGKPYLKNHSKLCFNLSHSGRYAAGAIGDSELGIDIQKIGKPNNKLARRFFTDNEYNNIISQKDDKAVQKLFYRYWALKESFIKAVGRGMNIALNEFEIEISKRENTGLVSNLTDTSESCEYYGKSETICIHQNINNLSYVFYEFNINGYITVLCKSVSDIEKASGIHQAKLVKIM